MTMTTTTTPTPTTTQATASRVRPRTRKPPKPLRPLPEPYRLTWWTRPGQPTFDDVCDALAFQHFILDELLQPVRESQWRAPTPSARWRVADLLGQVIASAEHVVQTAHASQPRRRAPVLDALDWYQGSGSLSTLTVEQARAVAGSAPGARFAELAELAELARLHRVAASTAAAILRSGEPGLVLRGAAGGITLADYTVTRLVGAVVHGLDLADALGRPGRAHGPAVRLVGGYFAALGERRGPAGSRSAPIALGTDGSLIALHAKRPATIVPAISWIQAATGRRPAGRLLPDSHQWLADLLPLAT
ncbi:maleylpyruvate isomerase N-terminal domain-containing protein [Catenulispora acidiphila]|nr:maleylpyruvate isomerase N-terminal domain-containing protein [Catenulispora acidiphila]